MIARPSSIPGVKNGMIDLEIVSFANRAWERFLGRISKKLVGNNVNQWVHKYSHPRKYVSNDMSPCVFSFIFIFRTRYFIYNYYNCSWKARIQFFSVVQLLPNLLLKRLKHSYGTTCLYIPGRSRRALATMRISTVYDISDSKWQRAWFFLIMSSDRLFFCSPKYLLMATSQTFVLYWIFKFL